MTTLSRRAGRVARAFAALSSLLAFGCAPQFDTASTVDTLRVMGVLKDKPYAQPGDEVNFAALWDDANERPAGEVTFTWIAGCTNPPDDLYSKCFQDVDPSKATIGTGNEFKYKIPEDIIETHAPPEDPGVVPYGIAYVYFAACAGDLKPIQVDTSGAMPTYPLGCFNKETGEKLGQDDFVVGYTAVYAYEKLTHSNPSISGFWYVDKPVTPDCIGVDCVKSEPPATAETTPACDDDTLCVPACEAEDDTCPAYQIYPIIDRPTEAESERTAQGEEQIWIQYLSDGATFTKDLTLGRDPSAGWIADYSTEFMAPAEPGLIYIWAVVRDSLGGQNWARIRVLVTE